LTDPDFPDELRSFIQDNIPNIDAAELLVLLAGRPDRAWGVPDLLGEMLPTVVAKSAAQKYLSSFQARGLVAQEGGLFRYAPQSAELDGTVRALARVFNERPVTLVRLIYSLRDERIRSFADAFRLKKD
jgi:hypothetical protein